MPKISSERVKLIYNPVSGRTESNPAVLLDILKGLQAQNFIPEVYLFDNGNDLPAVIQDALRRKIRLFVVCGGDGTIEAVSNHLIGKRATMGIIPTGTQNNIALSLGIPGTTSQAINLLKKGRRSKIDIGIVINENFELPFLEICSIGLFSALFQSADNLQKGNLASLGELLATLASFPLAKIDMLLDSNKLVRLDGHVVLVANLPYFGLNYRVTPDGSFDDGLLDVLVFSEYSKLELVGNVLQTIADEFGDHRIQRYRVKKLDIKAEPAMPVQADGASLGNTPVSIRVKRKAISIITGLPAQARSGGMPFGFIRNLNIFNFFKNRPR